MAQLCARLGERAAPFGLAVEHRFAVSGVRLGCGSTATAATGTSATSAPAGEALCPTDRPDADHRRHEWMRGVQQPDGGEIRIDGNPVTIRSVADAVALGIGFVHQELNVLDNLDVAANLFLGREPLWGGPLRLVDRSWR